MVAVVVQSDVSEAIPLLNDAGGGVYTAGRNTSTELRQHLLGGLFGKSGNTPFGYRGGVISTGIQSGGLPYDFKAVSTGGAGTQAVTVVVGRMVVPRSNQGVYLVGQSANINVNAPAADASNPRIDILAVMPYDKGAFGSDAVHGPKYIWITGDPAGAPTIPAIPAAVLECVPLVRILRGVNDNTIADADITDIRKSASIHGTPRHLLPGDALADAGGYLGERRIRTIAATHVDAVYSNAGYVMLEDRWDALNNVWRGTQPLHLPRPTINTSASMGINTTFTLATISVPDPGFPYRIDVSGSILQLISGGGAAAMQGVYLQFNIDSSSFTPAPLTNIIRTCNRQGASQSPATIELAGRYSTVLTGAHTVFFLIRNEANPAANLTWGNGVYEHCNVTILPA
jgi:hypothetical protein